MSTVLWERCSDLLHEELPEQQFNTWIRPLQPQEGNGELRLLAPNRFVLDWVNEKFMPRIRSLLEELSAEPMRVIIDLLDSQGDVQEAVETVERPVLSFGGETMQQPVWGSQNQERASFRRPASLLQPQHSDVQGADSRLMGSNRSSLNPTFTFQSFVEGKSNQLALAAARQVAENPGEGYNPLFIYGGVGLGKTHLMQAVGNELKRTNPNARVLYLHSERFVADMVKALQLNAINDFKRYYRSADALLIDDIQFFCQ